MKVLITHIFYDPNIIGGAEYSVKLLAEELVKRGNEVAIYTVDSFSNNLKKETINNVLVYRGTGGNFDTKVRFTKKGSIFRKVLNKIFELRNKKVTEEIRRVIKEFKPDVIHTNNVNGMSPLIWKVISEENIPCVHTIRDYWIVNPKNELKTAKRIINKPYQNYFRKYSKYVDYVTAPSKFSLDSVLQFNYFNKNNSICVNNSVNIDIKSTINWIENRRKSNEQIVKFMFVGSLFENKGIYNLINAFSNIVNDNITLTICGKGKLEEYIRLSCEKDKRIKYKGMLNKEELEKEWLENDVLIVPSIWDEPFGRVVIEANQHGLPVIGSNKGGILETINHINTGITYQYDSVEELTKSIQYFSNRNNIKKYYDAIIENIQQYSIEKQIESFLEIYEKVIRKKGEKCIK